MDSFGSWRTVYLVANVPLRLWMACQSSYVHPDEHFQTFQVLYNDNFPWELRDPYFVNRSIVPLWLAYGPPMALSRWLGLSTLGTYHLCRLALALYSWVVIDWCLYRIIPTRPERVKALVFVATAWSTHGLQSHSFSNALETCLLLPCVWVLDRLRRHEGDRSRDKFSKTMLMILGGVGALGTFNRVTFGVWLVLPGVFFVKYALQHPIRALIAPLAFIITAVLIVAFDTAHFHRLDFWFVVRMLGIDVHFKLLQFRLLPFSHWPALVRDSLHNSYVVAPLNNLLYNLDETNLSQHGLHPRYLHLLINYPLLVGPLLPLLPPFQRRYWRTTPFLACFSGILILSLVRHQELRFLLPMVPLLACLVNFEGLPTWMPTRGLLRLWIFYSVCLTFFYGLIHQAGVVPAMDQLNSIIPAHTTTQPPLVLFWRTLKPPTWMLNVQHREYTQLGVSQNLLVPHYFTKYDKMDLVQSPSDINIVDLMGAPVTQLDALYAQASPGQHVLLVAPLNALPNLQSYTLNHLWSTYWHMDMDHFEPEQGLATLTPGLGIYTLSHL